MIFQWFNAGHELARLRNFLPELPCVRGQNGWIERRSRAVDALRVNVLDFERAFAGLTDTDKIAVLLTYRDQLPAAHVADVGACAPGSIGARSRWTQPGQNERAPRCRVTWAREKHIPRAQGPRKTPVKATTRTTTLGGLPAPNPRKV